MKWSTKRERVYAAERSGAECAGAECLRNGMKDGVKQSARRSRLPLLFGDGGYNDGENDVNKRV